jgi:hypothetical protein
MCLLLQLLTEVSSLTILPKYEKVVFKIGTFRECLHSITNACIVTIKHRSCVFP